MEIRAIKRESFKLKSWTSAQPLWSGLPVNLVEAISNFTKLLGQRLIVLMQKEDEECLEF